MGEVGGVVHAEFVFSWVVALPNSPRRGCGQLVVAAGFVPGSGRPARAAGVWAGQTVELAYRRASGAPQCRCSAPIQ